MAGTPPRLAGSELACLAVAQAMPGFAPEPGWLRFVQSRPGARPCPTTTDHFGMTRTQVPYG
jgi:hypothetical protein